MGNYAYLCRADLRRTNPSFANPGYAPARNTIACARDHVALLWLGLFRPADLRTDRFVVDGELVCSRAPVVAARTGLGRLPAAARRLERLFPRGGALAAHAAALAAAIAAAPGRYLTIELEEIAGLWPRRARFDAALDQALACFAGADVRGIRSVLVRLSGVHADRPWPAAHGLYDRPRVARADAENLARLIGAEHLRRLPWERAAPRPTPAPRALATAVAAGDRVAVEAALAGPRPAQAVIDAALETAATAGAAAIVARLLPLASATGPTRALPAAMHRGHATIAANLLTAGADPNWYSRFTGSCWQAVLWGKVPPRMLATLVRHGGDLARPQASGGGYPLVQAAWVGKAPMIRALLRLGADPHVRDPFRRTPLAIAARAGHVDAVRALLPAATAAERAAAIAEVQKVLAGATVVRAPTAAEAAARRAALAVITRGRAAR